MRVCPKCGGFVMFIYRDMVEPARDRIQCEECDWAGTRYEGKEVEWKERTHRDPRKTEEA